MPLLIAVALIVKPADAHAQRPCEPCLTIVPVTELSTADGPIVPSRKQSILRTGEGRYVVSYRFVDPPQIAVYDSAGRFLELFERTGRGPGELRLFPELFPGPGDRIWALDQERLIEFDNRLAHIRTLNLGRRPAVGDVVPLSDTTVLVALRGMEVGAEENVFAVSVMDTAWSIGRTIERAEDEYGILAARSEDGRIFTLGSNQLQLRTYSRDGEAVRTVPIVGVSFQLQQGATATAGLEGFERRPRPLNRHLFVADDDHVVVLTRVTGSEWRPRRSDQMFRPSEEDDNRSFDTILSLVDARTGEVVSTRRVPESLQPLNGAPDLFHTTRVDRDGHVVTRILRVRVLR